MADNISHKLNLIFFISLLVLVAIDQTIGFGSDENAILRVKREDSDEGGAAEEAGTAAISSLPAISMPDLKHMRSGPTDPEKVDMILRAISGDHEGGGGGGHSKKGEDSEDAAKEEKAEGKKAEEKSDEPKEEKKEEEK